MPAKKAGKRKAPKRKAPKMVMMDGSGIFGDIWKGIKKGYDYVKSNKLVSKGLNLIPDERAKKLAKVAESAGLGRRRKPKTMRGRGLGTAPFLLDSRTVGASMIRA